MFRGAFFSLSKFVYAEILNIYYEGKFFYLRDFSKYMKGLFLIKGLGAKVLNFGVITLKLGVFIKHLGIKIS